MNTVAGIIVMGTGESCGKCDGATDLKQKEQNYSFVCFI